ncbi:alpha/beta fold hydrolase [Kribbella sp. CA-293567]|uniref:alpha/beta fold hydrolase n=1 Tax=Kribbella sp. CA-293567 TaxID=3002436 RepID=UPI0022DD034E|nr:alpha/beta hydrolase [Kribbella sp. CA-293567]WBQ04977.1 alpha/beta hydrolase [Kribbella sp. CA-293567]
MAANGARFHVAECGAADDPLVLFLHGFPEFWWAWRHQLPVVAAAGYRAVAMDLRGYGASDKTPRGYDPFTVSADVSGVIRSLGAADAVVVGHGWGGFVAWSAAVLAPKQVRALAAVSAPHPLQLMRSGQLRSVAQVGWFQLPILPERRLLAHDGIHIEQLLRAWSAPGGTFPDAEASRRYRAALQVWPAPHCALEYHRWFVRSRLRSDGRRYSACMRTPVAVPVLQVHGGLDGAVSKAATVTPAELLAGPSQHEVLTTAGHFPHEETPELFNSLLLNWLREPSPGPGPPGTS